MSTLLFISPYAYSRNTTLIMSIQEALETPVFKERLDPNISFYFGEQPHPKPLQSFGKFSSNKKTNAFNKSDEKACSWVLLSALLSLQDRARNEGGNAIIKITSYYKKKTYSSTSKYECHAGAIMAGVALSGEVVTLAE